MDVKKNFVNVPSLDELKLSNERYKFNCSDEDLKEYQKLLSGACDSYNFVGSFPLPAGDLKVDRSFVHPDADSNKYNAWYVKCHIKEKNAGGKLAGKKVAIKDNTAVANVPMMNGSKVMEGYVPEYDATVVSRILEEGGEIMGKTVCEDMCLSGASFNTTYDPVKNPVNPDFTAGGSSSGSAVVVATREVDMAIGGDQGGSIRIPSSNCGIVGLKPTHGLVPYTGAVPIVPVLDHLGPMARNVADCALLLEVIAGYDNGSDYRQNEFIPNVEYTKLIYPVKQPVRKLKIAVLQEGVDLCDDVIIKTFNKSVSWIKESSYLEVQDVSLPLHKDAINFLIPLLYDGTLGSMVDGCGFAATFAGLQSVSLVNKMFEGYRKQSSALSHPMKVISLLADCIREKHGKHFYAKASSSVVHMRHLYDNILQHHDVIVMPTLNKLPCRIPSESDAISHQLEISFNMIPNTAIFDATGHPALTLNCGFAEELPVGFMIVGKRFDDVTVLNAASLIEAAFADKLH